MRDRTQQILRAQPPHGRLAGANGHVAPHFDTGGDEPEGIDDLAFQCGAILDQGLLKPSRFDDPHRVLLECLQHRLAVGVDLQRPALLIENRPGQEVAPRRNERLEALTPNDRRELTLTFGDSLAGPHQAREERHQRDQRVVPKEGTHGCDSKGTDGRATLQCVALDSYPSGPRVTLPRSFAADRRRSDGIGRRIRPAPFPCSRSHADLWRRWRAAFLKYSGPGYAAIDSRSNRGEQGISRPFWSTAWWRPIRSMARGSKHGSTECEAAPRRNAQRGRFWF